MKPSSSAHAPRTLPAKSARLGAERKNLDVEWSLPDAAGEDADCILLSDADLLDVRPIATARK